MRNETLQTLENCKSQQARHQKIKSAFSTMLFELFGNKSLTDACIRFPVCSAEQPAYVLKQFGEAWEAAKDSTGLQKNTRALAGKYGDQLEQANSDPPRARRTCSLDNTRDCRRFEQLVPAVIERSRAVGRAPQRSHSRPNRSTASTATAAVSRGRIIDRAKQDRADQVSRGSF